MLREIGYNPFLKIKLGNWEKKNACCQLGIKHENNTLATVLVFISVLKGCLLSQKKIIIISINFYKVIFQQSKRSIAI